jgi:CHAT domain
VSVLCIRHYEASGNRLADLTWTGDESLGVSLPFTPKFDRFDLEDVRWYHEMYRQNWRVSSNGVIQRIQRAERKIGEALHEALFHGDAFPLAEKVRCAGPNLRIEIRDEVHSAAVPWELITDPHTGQELALAASSFVRALGGETDVPAEGVSRAVCRLLLLISRPGGGADVGYWSVAYALWRELAGLPYVKVDVLRPPTFDALVRHLDEALQSGTPYAAVHFDGHGTVVDPFGGTRTRGYLVFETAGRAGPEFIDGSRLGRALAAANVLLFSMNACRSADSEGGDRHVRAARESAVGQPSIVEDVLAEGVASCIGMRREIYPGTAARFFGVFYPEFFGGRSVGEAAKIARVRLHQEPLAATRIREEIAPVNDWSIPVVGERTVVRLQEGTHEGRREDGPELGSSSLPEHLSAPPIVGFDRAILKLEDMLAEASVVVVHGPLLSGKSRLAVEYAKWLSATSLTSCPVLFVRLSASDTPDVVAARMSPRAMLAGSAVPGDPARFAESLKGWGGILILDQVDRLTPETETFLGNVLSRLEGECRVIVTVRAGSLSWLPGCRSVVPDVLVSDERPELGRRWADAKGARFDLAAVRPLLFFSGGLPGMILLLLGAAHDMISRHEASADGIASWLAHGRWDRIVHLGSNPGFGLPSVEALADEIVADLLSVCDTAELAIIRILSRFHVGFDDISAARLVATVSGAEVSAGALSRVIGKLLSSGLATRDVSAAESAWLLHPLLKLVASRLFEASDPDDDDLQDAFIETISRKCADLAARYRTDTAAIVDMLDFHKQNMSDALYTALERGQLLASSFLTEGLCLYCRFVGDADLASRVLDHTLPYFIDTRSGVLRPESSEIGLRVWDQAIWLSAYWPRKRQLVLVRQGPARLAPPENDHYAHGLWFRAIGRLDDASKAFRVELDTPAQHPRYVPGDIECYLSETLYYADQAKSLPDALRESRQSYAARHASDSLGRAWSRISEVRIRIAMVFSHEDYQVDAESDTARIQVRSEDRAELDEIADLLREAQSEAGGQSAENRSQAAMLWSDIMLARGDLTSAVSHFEEGIGIMGALEEPSICSYYWWFARHLIYRGWITRGYEYAVNAFQFAMQTGDQGLSTSIHKFIQNLKATYPELAP